MAPKKPSNMANPLSLTKKTQQYIFGAGGPNFAFVSGENLGCKGIDAGVLPKAVYGDPQALLRVLISA